MEIEMKVLGIIGGSLFALGVAIMIVMAVVDNNDQALAGKTLAMMGGGIILGVLPKLIRLLVRCATTVRERARSVVQRF